VNYTIWKGSLWKWLAKTEASSLVAAMHSSHFKFSVFEVTEWIRDGMIILSSFDVLQKGLTLRAWNINSSNVHTYTRAPVTMRTDTRTHTHTHTHARMCTQTHTYLHAHMHAHKHAHTHTWTHTNLSSIVLCEACLPSSGEPLALRFCKGSYATGPTIQGWWLSSAVHTHAHKI
jgi:hypothetical protein